MNRPNHHYHRLNLETRTKIVTMRNYSTSTFEQIAIECDCSVNR